MCNCGCGGCQTKIQGPLLTEGKVKSLLSEGLQYHIDKQVPLFETVYRIGSEKHLALIKEARKMYSRNVIDLCEEDEALIKTHLGEFGIYEGETVPLDLPMLNEFYDYDEVAQSEFGMDYDQLGPGEKEWVRDEIDNMLNEGVNIKSNIESLITQLKSKDLIKSGNTYGNPSGAQGKFKITVYPKVSTSSNVKPFFNELKKYYEFLGITDTGKRVFKFDNRLYGWLVNNEGSSVDIVLMRRAPIKEGPYQLDEAEYKGKDVPLNKPKRGGSKAYYVYVRDPKTKKVKKVSFGSGGLRAKIKNKEARNAFAKRHRCKNKKDRTKPGFWSCNLPKYAKLLGLGANQNTFW